MTVSTNELRLFIGLTALISSSLYLLSDLVELVQGGLNPIQFYLTYIAFAAVPFYIIGLHALQSSKVGWVSLIGAVCYGGAFIFFAGTDLYALVDQTSDYTTLVEKFGLLYAIHGGLLVIGGVLFGTAVYRAAVLPRWSGIMLIIGSVLAFVLKSMQFPEIAQVFSSTIRNLAFIGMAVTVLKRDTNLRK